MENRTFSKDELIQSWDWSTAACKKKKIMHGSNNKGCLWPSSHPEGLAPSSQENGPVSVSFFSYSASQFLVPMVLWNLYQEQNVQNHISKEGKWKSDAPGRSSKWPSSVFVLLHIFYWYSPSPSEWGRNVLEVINPRNIASLESNLESAGLTMQDLQLLTVSKTPQVELKCAAINKWRKVTQSLTLGKEAMLLILVSLIPGDPTFSVRTSLVTLLGQSNTSHPLSLLAHLSIAFLLVIFLSLISLRSKTLRFFPPLSSTWVHHYLSKSRCFWVSTNVYITVFCMKRL